MRPEEQINLTRALHDAFHMKQKQSARGVPNTHSKQWGDGYQNKAIYVITTFQRITPTYKLKETAAFHLHSAQSFTQTAAKRPGIPK